MGTLLLQIYMLSFFILPTSAIAEVCSPNIYNELFIHPTRAWLLDTQSGDQVDTQYIFCIRDFLLLVSSSKCAPLLVSRRQLPLLLIEAAMS
jgi:hypothetical protein